jgi:hypothetical protein
MMREDNTSSEPSTRGEQRDEYHRGECCTRRRRCREHRSRSCGSARPRSARRGRVQGRCHPDSVAALIKGAEAVAHSLGVAAEEANIIVSSAVRSTAEKRDARRLIEDAASQRERLQSEIADLRERLKEVRQQEEDAKRWVRYRQAEAECEQLAAEFAAVYPEFAKKMAELLPRIVENERWVDYINAHALPTHGRPLRTAEMVARGIDRSVDFPRITQVLRLPTFEYGPHEPYVWPRSR